jgi:CheY-like chemotaxis protein
VRHAVSGVRECRKLATANMKRILLIDLDDPRRKTRVKILQGAGYEVDVRKDEEVGRVAHTILSRHNTRRVPHSSRLCLSG